MDHGIDGAGSHDLGAERPHVGGVAEHDRHDGHATGHRQAERTLLERSEAPGARAGALRRDRQRLAARERALDERGEGGDRTLRIGPVDEHRVGERADEPHDRVGRELLLGDRGDVAAQERHHEERVDRALVVEQEHRRSVRPHVFLADHVEVDPGQSEAQVASDRDHRVHRVGAAAVEDAQADARSRSR